MHSRSLLLLRPVEGDEPFTPLITMLAVVPRANHERVQLLLAEDVASLNAILLIDSYLEVI